jgi:hypothetical protein
MLEEVRSLPWLPWSIADGRNFEVKEGLVISLGVLFCVSGAVLIVEV